MRSSGRNDPASTEPLAKFAVFVLQRSNDQLFFRFEVFIESHARDACFFEYVVDAHSVKSGGADEPPSDRKKMITLPAWHI